MHGYQGVPGPRGCSQIVYGIKEGQQMKWPWRRRPMDCEANQNVRSKLNLELGARIMNVILSFESLWVVSEEL